MSHGYIGYKRMYEETGSGTEEEPAKEEDEDEGPCLKRHRRSEKFLPTSRASTNTTEGSQISQPAPLEILPISYFNGLLGVLDYDDRERLRLVSRRTKELVDRFPELRRPITLYIRRLSEDYMSVSGVSEGSGGKAVHATAFMKGWYPVEWAKDNKIYPPRAKGQRMCWGSIWKKEPWTRIPVCLQDALYFMLAASRPVQLHLQGLKLSSEIVTLLASLVPQCIHLQMNCCHLLHLPPPMVSALLCHANIEIVDSPSILFSRELLLTMADSVMVELSKANNPSILLDDDLLLEIAKKPSWCLLRLTQMAKADVLGVTSEGMRRVLDELMQREEPFQFSIRLPSTLFPLAPFKDLPFDMDNNPADVLSIDPLSSYEALVRGGPHPVRIIIVNIGKLNTEFNICTCSKDAEALANMLNFFR